MDDIRGAFERHTDCLFPESADYWRCRGWKREFDSSSVLRTGLCSASLFLPGDPIWPAHCRLCWSAYKLQM
ncbi:hypothetical protein Y1Q_0001353 [Alligator mississippiensis]|uniref:Uncharacterized protein n=1 Tax=Alligator mississippiensis TaxID=8496 RepID=A0A151M951_ALLMI|nr:hypothetical protein Y1Q_0001353 [Alligator mississippiensis]